jgi:hypothetical protein
VSTEKVCQAVAFERVGEKEVGRGGVLVGRYAAGLAYFF